MRTNVYDPDDDGALVGWFDFGKADCWQGAYALDENLNKRDINTWSTTRAQALLRTAGGRWVLQKITNWDGENDRWTFVAEDRARDWLIRNNHDDAVTQYFGPLPEESGGRGRPEIGGVVQVRLGTLLPTLNAYAYQAGLTRAEAVRVLLARALADADATKTT